MTNDDNIHQMNPAQRENWIKRKLVVHTDSLPPRDLINRNELKKRLLSELESFIPTKEASEQRLAKKRRMTYNDLVDESFKNHLNKMTEDLKRGNGKNASSTAAATTTTTTTTAAATATTTTDGDDNDATATQTSPASADTEEINNNNNNTDMIMIDDDDHDAITHATTAVGEQEHKRQQGEKVDDEIRPLRPQRLLQSNIRKLSKYLEFHGKGDKVTTEIHRRKGYFPFGKTMLVKPGCPPRVYEYSNLMSNTEKEYMPPNLEAEKNSFSINVPEMIVQYVKSDSAQFLFNYNASRDRLTMCEECLIKLGKHYYDSFLVANGNSEEIKELWIQLYQSLVQGGLTQVSLPHLNLQFIFFIFYSYLSESRSGSVDHSEYSAIVVECSKHILANIIQKELQREDDIYGSSLLDTVDTYGEILANNLTPSEFKSLVYACNELLLLHSASSDDTAEIVLHLAYRIVTLASRIFGKEHIVDAIDTTILLIEMHSLMGENNSIGNNVFVSRIAQKIHQLISDAILTLLSDQYMTETIIHVEFFRVKEDALRVRFFSELDNTPYRLFRHLVDFVAADPSKLIPFVETFAGLLYDDVRSSILNSNANTKANAANNNKMANSTLAKQLFNTKQISPASLDLIHKCQVKVILMLCHAVEQGIHKYRDNNNEDEEVKKSADMFHLLILKKVFHFLVERGENYVDTVLQTFIRDRVLSLCLEPLTMMPPSELVHNIMWPQILLFLSDIIKIDYHPFFDRLQSFWLVVMGICTSTLTATEFETLNQTLDVVFSTIFTHRFTMNAIQKYFVALDQFIEKYADQEGDFEYSMEWYPPIRRYFRHAVQLLTSTQIVEFYEMLIKNVQSRIEVEDILKKPQLLELLLFPLTTFDFNVVINESNFQTLQNLAKKIDQGIVAPLMHYALSLIKNGEGDAMFTTVLKLHYSLTVLIKRTREFSSDIYTYKPIQMDDKTKGEDLFIDFRSDSTTTSGDSKERSGLPDGYRLSDFGGMKLKALFKKISFTARSILCYLLFERVSLFYQQIMIMRYNYLHVAAQEQKDNEKTIKYLESNLQKYFTFLKDEFIKNAKKHASNTETWNGEVELVTNIETYIIMLWFLITSNLSQFIQFLEVDDLKTVLDFMITQLAVDATEVDQEMQDANEKPSGKVYTLANITTRVWGNALLEWVDYEKPREILFQIFKERLEKDIKSIQKDKRVSSLLKRVKGLASFDEAKELEKMKKKNERIPKSDVPFLPIIKIRKAMDKLFKKSKNKAYKRSDILHGEAVELEPAKSSFAYIPLLLQLPRDHATLYFDESQNFIICALLVVLETVLTLNAQYSRQISLRSTISSMLDLPMNKKHLGLLFNKALFTLQMQHFDDEKSLLDILELQSKMLGLRLPVHLSDTDNSDVLKLVFSNYKKDDEQQARQRLIISTKILQTCISYVEKSHSNKSFLVTVGYVTKRVAMGLFFEKNKSSPSFLDYEVHWLSQLKEQQEDLDDLKLDETQALHISQVLLLCLQLTCNSKELHFFSDLDPTFWGLILYLCENHLRSLQLMSSDAALSASTEIFLSNVLQASGIYSQFEESDPSSFMKKPLAPLFELAFATLLKLVQIQREGKNEHSKVLMTDFSEVIPHVVRITSFPHRAFMIKHINENLASITSCHSPMDLNRSSIIIANVTTLSQIFAELAKETSLIDLFRGTILKALSECVVTCRLVPRNPDDDWLLQVINFAAELSAVGITDPVSAHYLFDIISNAVLILKDDCERCKQLNTATAAADMASPFNSWSIFSTIGDMLQRLLAKNMIHKQMMHIFLNLMKLLVDILLEQQFVKLVSGKADMAYYMENIQVACDKVKVLYNTISDSKLNKFMEQIMFDLVYIVASHYKSLPKENSTQHNADLVLAMRSLVLTWLVTSGAQESDQMGNNVAASSTLVTLFHSGVAPDLKRSIPKRLNEDATALKIFSDICNRQQMNKKK